MKGAPRIFAPQRHLLSRSRSNSNQSQNSLYVSPSPTPTSPSTSAPSPSLRLAPTPASMRGASVREASFGIPVSIAYCSFMVFREKISFETLHKEQFTASFQHSGFFSIPKYGYICLRMFPCSIISKYLYGDFNSFIPRNLQDQF
jgi:hypothetical protein